MTVLTLYHTVAPATTLTSADIFVTSTGSLLTNRNTTIGTSTGYGEVQSQGTSTAWPSLTSLPSPTGNGWLWDDTTLASGGAVFSAGTWTLKANLRTSVGSIIANIHSKVWRRASNNVYNLIADLSLNTQTITSTFAQYTLTNTTTSPSTAFGTGDLLYNDIWLSVTSNSTGNSTALVEINNGNSNSTGNAGAELVTPGFSSITSVFHDAVLRFGLQSANTHHDAAIRFGLRSSSGSGSDQHNAAMRFRLSSVSTHLALFPNATRRAAIFPPATRRQTI